MPATASVPVPTLLSTTVSWSTLPRVCCGAGAEQATSEIRANRESNQRMERLLGKGAADVPIKSRVWHSDFRRGENRIGFFLREPRLSGNRPARACRGELARVRLPP